jgi:hypothetical protein
MAELFATAVLFCSLGFVIGYRKAQQDEDSQP